MTASAKVRKCGSAKVRKSPSALSHRGGEDRGGVALTHGEAERVGRLWDALREVMDPEIPISVVDLGLIYDIRLDGATAEVDLTFTATACPCMAFIQWDVAERLQREEGVEDVRIREVWNPPWTKARISAEGRRRLRELGVSV